LRFTRLLTAVILLVIVLPELFTVIASTDKISLTASMAVMLTPVIRSVTVPLSLVTRLLGSTTPPASRIVPAGTSLTRFWLEWHKSVYVIELELTLDEISREEKYY